MLTYVTSFSKTALHKYFLRRYNDHFASEVKIIDKLPQLAHDEANVFMLELRQFLHAYPKLPNERKMSSAFSINDETYDFIPKQMIICEYQVEAVHNWMAG